MPYQTDSPGTAVNAQYGFVGIGVGGDEKILEAMIKFANKPDQSSQDTDPSFGRQIVSTIYGAIKDSFDVEGFVLREYRQQLVMLDRLARAGTIIDRIRFVAPGAFSFVYTNVRLTPITIEPDAKSATIPYKFSGVGTYALEDAGQEVALSTPLTSL